MRLLMIMKMSACSVVELQNEGTDTADPTGREALECMVRDNGGGTRHM